MQRLMEGARALDLRLSARQVAAFQLYYQELVRWNRRFNLTAITGYEQVQIRHFLDSLSCLLAGEVRRTLARRGARVIDVGSGAGFPGIPLKLVCPAIRLTLLEATGKKVSFLEHIIERLELRRVEAIHARAENLAHDPAHREGYDLALARAVAALPAVAEYTLPFCRIGGWTIAQKGEAGAAEAWAAEEAIHRLGGELHRIVPVELPGLPEDRSLVVIAKVSPTPERYP
ncbi:MAG TPA: 16S rRNA (guanine(527)-N(7))-methyltransferase RsmG, partial [Anaerolineae bacterium]|nr:16S rRNA (guanine(527)-N(7))-methyltransferase RsmG [Anaerolineae bacterium]